jgi:soluble lytic murein transglycosylase-like protein
VSRLRWTCLLLFACGTVAASVFIVASCYEAQAATKHCETVKECRRAVVWARHDRARLRAKLAANYKTSVDTAFQLAEIIYGMPKRSARIIGQCESHLNPFERNSATATGVMQELDSTFGRTPFSRIRIPHLYAAYDAVVNILAAGYIWRQDGGSFREWSCSAITGVR